MQAWVLERTAPVDEEPLTLKELPLPRPEAGQVLLRVEACGICHTDLHIVQGDLGPLAGPRIPGHQVVGRIEAAGETPPSGAEAPAPTGPLQPGQRVGVMWLYSACGRCAACIRGSENLCPQARFTGWDADGGFATHMLAPADFVVPLPDEVPAPRLAPLLCAGVIGYRSLRLADVRPGDRLGLFGFGAAAHIVLQVAKAWGCQVCVFSRGEAHRRLARELGAYWTGTADEAPPEPCDAAITFAPAGWLIPRALEKLRPGGTLAVNAIHLDQVPAFPYRLLWGERVVRSVANVTRRDAWEFLPLAERLGLHVQVEEVPFTELPAGLRRLQAAQIQGAAVLRP